MTAGPGPWGRRADVAWIGDESRVIAARTSPPDPDGPRILGGAAAALWVRLHEPRTSASLAAEAGDHVVIEQALLALSEAGLIETV